MKKKPTLTKIVLHLLTILLITFTGTAQTNISKDGAVLAGTRSAPGGNIVVYEQPPDYEGCITDAFGGTNGCKKYCYLPVGFELEKKLNNIPNIKIGDDSLSLLINIIPEWPDRSEVLSLLNRSGINNIVFNSISRLNFFDVEVGKTVRNDRGLFVFQNQLPNAFNLNDAFTATLHFNSKQDCISSNANILDGSLKLSICIAMKLWNKTFYRLDVNLQSLVASDVYSEFLSPVEGNTIFLGRLQICTSQIESYIKTRVVREGDHNPLMETDLQNFWQEHFGFRKRVIVFDSINQLLILQRQPSNFDTLTRTQTNVIKKFAQDAETLSDNEFYHKHHDELIKILDDSSYRLKDGRGRASIMKLFSGGGSYKSETAKKMHNELRKIFDDEKQLRNYFRNSFHYEQEGLVYQPKGIIASEVLTAKDILKRNQEGISISYTQALQYIPYSIKL